VSDRLFFALWPDQELRERLAQRLPAVLAGYPCRPQRPDQWHLTLEFLGEVEAERQRALREAASLVASPVRIEIVFDRLEHWARSQVLCMVATEVPAAVLAMVDSLRMALAAQGFSPEQRAWRPHLTLARKARRPIPSRPVEPLCWSASEFVLVRSITDPAGSRYEPLGRWNLHPAPAPASAS